MTTALICACRFVRTISLAKIIVYIFNNLNSTLLLLVTFNLDVILKLIHGGYYSLAHTHMHLHGIEYGIQLQLH